MTADDFKEWRRAMGYSREEAAYALGLSKPTIENYESGRRRGSNRPVVIPKYRGTWEATRQRTRLSEHRTVLK
ncbi:helix-turn-helix transcriptional regulator [Mesorhizobium sp. CGMCC 1.15528]|uniref:Helix-turn-helix transcriptional regulator n=1 Tax=Mesorhizobium zhangyense TaxID=1776730 RepID=A0A7C9RBX5_9HYPH|nr:helix-turn-helix transcriptional regulator [Mesorhizobium zhangyense]